MKKEIFTIIAWFLFLPVISQNENLKPFLMNLSINGCRYLDSLSSQNLNSEQFDQQVSRYIDDQVRVYATKVQAGYINWRKFTKTSEKYQQYYTEIESYLRSNCSYFQHLQKTMEKVNPITGSNNTAAKAEFDKGILEHNTSNFDKSIVYFKKAIEIDPVFSMAWDNLGFSYFRMNKKEEAAQAYRRSLEIAPLNIGALQDIAIASMGRNEFKNAIIAYEKITILDSRNPEAYYGLGEIYAFYLKNYEKGLDNLCKSFTLYSEQNSVYQMDAEKYIRYLYFEMKKMGMESTAEQILTTNNLSTAMLAVKP